MLQLNNTTPFAADIAIFPNEQGIDTLYVIAKATFNISETLTLNDEQLVPQMVDEYYGEPGLSSLKSASDYHPDKIATDIIMQGNAMAPNGDAVTVLDVGLLVGSLKKSVRIFGDRKWNNGFITSPLTFTEMPLMYEKSYGGRYDIDSENYIAQEYNPVGCGYLGKRSKSDLNDTLLPNIESPQDLISYYKDNPLPQCFGPCGPDWLPRRSFVGTYDDQWHKNRAPYLPQDFNKRFYNSAHPDLIYPGFLQGGEQVSIRHMHAEGDIKFNLPVVNLKAVINIGSEKKSIDFNIETLILEPNLKRFSMVWKAPFTCDKNLLNIDSIELRLHR